MMAEEVDQQTGPAVGSEAGSSKNFTNGAGIGDGVRRIFHLKGAIPAGGLQNHNSCRRFRSPFGNQTFEASDISYESLVWRNWKPLAAKWGISAADDGTMTYRLAEILLGLRFDRQVHYVDIGPDECLPKERTSKVFPFTTM